jgi:hypothetical protein
VARRSKVGGHGDVDGGSGTANCLGVDDAVWKVGNPGHLAGDGGGEEGPGYT